MRAAIATEADASAILPLMEDFNRFESITTWTRENGEAPLRRLLRDPSLGVVGLFFDPALIGYFVLTFGFDLEWGGRDAFLTELYLVPEARSRGRGPELVAHVDRVARELDVKALHLMVRPENERARRLYVSQGFGVSPRLFMTKILEA